jgi:hypothetical protein
MADAIEWIARHEGIESILHYHDDYQLIGPAPNSEKGKEDLDWLLAIFEAPDSGGHKEGPAWYLPGH